MGRKKYIYYFGNGKADGRGDMKDILGGKGAGLAEMTNLKIPVPAGFTITTEACREYFRNKKKYPTGLWEEVLLNLKKIEKAMGMKLGDLDNPLLVSVRSGAKFSMPGMMDTVLNLGINETTLRALYKKTGNERFVYDAYRRFITMFGSIVMGVDRQKFEKTLEEMKKMKGVHLDTELVTEDLKDLVQEYKMIYKKSAILSRTLIAIFYANSTTPSGSVYGFCSALHCYFCQYYYHVDSQNQKAINYFGLHQQMSRVIF